MTLQIPFDQFAETVKRLLPSAEAFVAHHRQGSLVTSGDPVTGVVVASLARYRMEETLSRLRDAGLDAHEGAWALEGELMISSLDQPPYVVAVSYASVEQKPGVWVDAYAHEPTPAEVLMNLYDEFRETGELGDVSFEEFLRYASPNVVIVSPEEAARYVERKSEQGI